MVHDFIYPVLRCLHWVERYRLRWGGDVTELQACISELKFLHVCLRWFSRYDKDDDEDLEKWKNLKSMLDAIGSNWEDLEGVLDLSKKKEGVLENFSSKYQHLFQEFQAKTSGKEETDVPWVKVVKAIENWNRWNSKIRGTIKECKLNIRVHCTKLLHCTFKYRFPLSVKKRKEKKKKKCRFPPSVDETLEFLDEILQHLKPNNHNETLKEKVMLMQALFKLIPDDSTLEKEGDDDDDISNDVNKVAWLTFFFWSKEGGDEEIADEVNLLLSDLSRKIIRPSVPDVASWYFGALKAMRLPRPDDNILLGQAVPGIIDLLFEYLGIHFDEDYEILRDGMIILFTYLAIIPKKEYLEDEELLLIRDQLGNFLLFPPIGDARKVHVNNFATKIESLKDKIRKLHNYIPDYSSSCNFPRTNGIGFIDLLLQTLKENLNSDNTSIPFAKHLIIEIEQELVSLRPNLDAIFELQKEHKELQDIWLQLTNLAYLTEHAVNSCSVVLYPICYNMVRLSDILDELKVIKGKLDAVKHSYSYNAVVLPKSVGSYGEIPTQGWYTGANKVIVGCDEEVDTIIQQLTRGPKSLEIVSIVGMGGSGKSTLVGKVYRTPHVRNSFHIFAYCTVSQVYKTRKILVEILKDMNEDFIDQSSKTDVDLAHLLHQQLSGRRYLVVMDDIWEIDAWEKVKSSFPDDSQGSRVIFTSREHEVAMRANSKFSPHFKHLLSDEESLELLQTMVFPQGGCPLVLSEAGKVIAKNCKGLPLAVVLVARLLERKERNMRSWNDKKKRRKKERMRSWNEIAEKTASFVSEEGCMKVVELSYTHLPEHLKSCFLYFGVFAQEESILAKRLMLLWIAEGFVQKRERDGIEIVAKEYLTELVDRSLIQVVKRSPDNGIKTCQLHDVIRDFCQRKAQEENFFQLIHGIAACNSSHSNLYRLCICMDRESFVDTELRDPGIKSLVHHEGCRSSYRCGGSKSILLNFQLVQVLDLEKVELVQRKGEVNGVFESMSSLVHLRYLAVSIGDKDIVIPSRMSNLKNLETLILRRRNNAGELWGSETFWRMERLRHLDIGLCYLIPRPFKFEAYPPLYNLQSFSKLVLKPGTAKTVLQRLPNLRKLSCVFCPDSGNASILALDVLNKLESLKLNLGDDANVILPASLKKLSLHGKRLPSQLGKLPLLEVLNIRRMCEFKWDTEDGEFPELKFLKMKNPILKEWNVADGSFPRMEQLVLVRCFNLQELPASFRESATLKKIQIRKSKPGLKNSAVEIRDEQKDLGNEIELII